MWGVTNTFRRKSLQLLSKRRNITSKFFRKETVDSLKIKDNVPDEFNLIYRNTMARYLLAAQIITITATAIVVVSLLTRKDFQDMTLHMESWQMQPGSVENEFFVYIAAFAAFVSLLQVLVKKMPLRVYNYPRQRDYVIISYSTLPGRTNRTDCKLKDITKCEEVGYLPWRDSWFNVENKGKILLLENMFKAPVDFNVLSGHQKPPEEDD